MSATDKKILCQIDRQEIVPVEAAERGYSAPNKGWKMKAFTAVAIFVSALFLTGCQICSNPNGTGDGSSCGSGGGGADGGSSEVDAGSPDSCVWGPDGGPPWCNTCDWCNGPGCEELDEPCQNVESGSRGVTCDTGYTLGPANHCFDTLDKWGQNVLCCCLPGQCPGV